ncbi:hypothetical protein BV898_20091, partial [Hypsibius exemplaris]
NCDYVVLRSLPYEGYQVKNAAEFCATCQCKHENRNSVTIKAVVILFIVVVALLIVYMVYLLIEARLCKGATKAMSEDSATSVAYEQHLDDEVDSLLLGGYEVSFLPCLYSCGGVTSSAHAHSSAPTS